MKRPTPFDALLESFPEPKSAKQKSPRRPLVLVIDDDVSIRQALELVLDSQYQVTLCSSAAEGISAFNEETCAVILDVKMQGRDGFWACDQIRRIAPDVPIIFYSAYQNAKDPFEIINQHRPFAYIAKDGSVQRLLDSLETATRLYQSTLTTRRILEKLKRGRAESA